MTKMQVAVVMMSCLCAAPVMADYVVCRQDAQPNLAVTIYNTNLGLVKDVRVLKLKPGVQQVQFMDVASQINPVTVHIKSLQEPDKLTVLEQNYEYDLLNAQKLLDKYVGKTLKMVDKNYYTGEEQIVAAELLSNNNGPLFRINGEIHINAPGRIILPEIPENLIAQPTLVWLLDNKSKRPHQLEASYLTGGMNWRADYVAVIADDNRKADLNGWVTIDNQSGATYRDATLKLVAGEVHRVRDDVKSRGLRVPSMAAEPDAQFQQESFFEYHLYRLQRPTTLKDRQTKQIELFAAADIAVRERLIYQGVDYYFRDRYSPPSPTPQSVGVFLEIANTAANNLGMPLPAGIIRAYKKDSGGSLQFVGEDRLRHTPRDETITLKMGNAFDVVAERKQLDYKILSRSATQRFDTEQTWEITLRNRKNTPVAVEVVEPTPGVWSMVKSSHAFDKTDAHTIRFSVPIEKNSTQTITYTVHIRYY